MRKHLLTEQERKIIKTYVETGEKLPGFAMLLSRSRHMPAINEDLVQIKWLLAKVEAEKAKK